VPPRFVMFIPGTCEDLFEQRRHGISHASERP
jgi:hypothetical protein